MLKHNDLYEPSNEDSVALRLDARSILGFGRRQALLIVATTVAGVLVALLIAALLTPLYTARASLLFSHNSGSFQGELGLGQPTQVSQEMVASQALVMQSPQILQNALQTSGLVDDLWEQRARGVFPWLTGLVRPSQNQVDVNTASVLGQLTQDLRDSLRIDRERQTLIVTIAVENPNPVFAARLANTVGEAFLAHQIARKLEQARQAQAALTQRVATLNRDIQALEEQINMLLVDAAASNQIAHNTPLSHLDAELLQRMHRFHAEREALIGEQRQLNDVLMQAQLIGGFSVSNDDHQTLRLEQATARLATIEQRLSQIRAAGQSARQRVVPMLSDMGEAGGVLDLALGQIMHDLEVREALHHEATQQLSRASLGTLSQFADAQLVTPATAPLHPSFPSYPLALCLGLILGSGLGIAGGLMREQMFAGIVSADVLETAFGITVAAQVPAVHRTQARQSGSYVLDQPMSGYSEAIRRLALSVDAHTSHTTGGRCVLFSSANEGEGKTTLAMAYASQLAAAGRKTLLLDADFRNSSLLYRMPGTAGYSGQVTANNDFLHFMKEARSVSQIMQAGLSDPSSGLVILPNAHASDIATDALVGGHRFAAVISAARTLFDVIVIDSPPILPVVDARILKNHADLVCLCVQYAKTTQEDVRQALQELEAPGAPHLLAVLSRADRRRARGYPATDYTARAASYSFEDTGNRLW